jgi:hypothetical protein
MKADLKILLLLAVM